MHFAHLLLQVPLHRHQTANDGIFSDSHLLFLVGLSSLVITLNLCEILLRNPHHQLLIDVLFFCQLLLVEVCKVNIFIL